MENAAQIIALIDWPTVCLLGGLAVVGAVEAYSVTTGRRPFFETQPRRRRSRLDGIEDFLVAERILTAGKGKLPAGA